MVCLVWFALFNDDDLKRSLIPLKVAKPSLKLHLGTTPGRLGCWVGSNSDYKAISVQLQLQLPAGTELGKNGFTPTRIYYLLIQTIYLYYG